MAGLSVRSALDGNERALMLTGDLAVADVEELAAPALEALCDRSVRTLVLDLDRVTFIDSTGLGALVSLAGTATDVGTRLVLRNPTERIIRMLRLIHMDTAFVIDPPLAP